MHLDKLSSSWGIIMLHSSWGIIMLHWSHYNWRPHKSYLEHYPPDAVPPAYTQGNQITQECQLSRIPLLMGTASSDLTQRARKDTHFLFSPEGTERVYHRASWCLLPGTKHGLNVNSIMNTNTNRTSGSDRNHMNTSVSKYYFCLSTIQTSGYSQLLIADNWSLSYSFFFFFYPVSLLLTPGSPLGVPSSRCVWTKGKCVPV